MYNSGRRGKRTTDNYGIISAADSFNQATYPIPIINSWSVTDGSYNPQQDLALLPAGGETVVLYGAGFTSGITVNINGVNISPVTLLDPNRVTFTSPALSAGTYTIYASNTDGATAIYLPGLQYAGAPTWTQPAAGSIGSMYETQNTRVVLAAANTTFVATAANTPITYAVTSGSLPTGATLSTSGILSGNTAIGSGSATTYTFTVTATNALLETSTRTFSLTINPDVVTWTAPSQNGTLPVYEYQTPASLTATDAAGYGIVYTSNIATYNGNLALSSTGTWSGNVGSANSATANNNVYFLATATANTTGRFANSNVKMTIVPDVVTWSSPANNTTYSLVGGVAISNVTLSAASAAGFGVQYAANTLPTGISISGNTIYGTPTVAQTVNTLVTATANTSNRSTPIIINWTISLNDTFFNYTTLLLNGETTANSFINDASNNNFGLTIVGDTKPTPFTPYYNDGYYSVLFDGASYLAATPGTPVTIGTSDFCFEGWGYWTSFNYGTYGAPICSLTGTSSELMIRANKTTASTTSANWYNIVGGSSYIPSAMFSAGMSFGTLYLNRWHHLAVQRVSGTWYFYIDGVQVGTTATGDGSLSTAFTACYVGNDVGSANGYMAGYVSNVRLTVGSAPYTTSGFTVPTSPLTNITNTKFLLAQSNRYVDKSNNNSVMTTSGTISISQSIPFNTPTSVTVNTGYSVYFNGSTDYLTFNPSTSSQFGTGDFTVEAWIYPTSSLSTQYIIDMRSAAATTGWLFAFGATSSGKLSWYYNAFSVTETTASVVLNTWNHVAYSRVSGTGKLFVNGNLATAGVSDTNNYVNTNTIAYIASRFDQNTTVNPSTLTGYISNLRIVKGTGLYTNTFTPSTTPLTAVANTSLLTCQTDTMIKDNSSNAFAISVSGSPKVVNNTYPFTQTTATVSNLTTLGSAYFDGSGDYLSVANNTATNLGTGDFTIEFRIWANPTQPCSNPRLLSTDTWNTSAGYDIDIEGSLIQFRSGGGVSKSCSFTTSDYAVWNHIAFSRSGTTFRVFKNGVLANTYTDSSNLTSANPTYIARYAATTGNEFAGYISDVRIVKGTAVYTTNFTPPTSPLTAIANTSLLTLQYNGGANNSGIIDNSPFNNIITRNGNSSQGSFSPYSQTGWSNYFNGSTDYLTLPSSSTAYNFGASVDFTIEAWVYPTVLAGSSWGIIDARVNGATSAAWLLQLVPSAGTYRLEFFNAGANDGTTSIPLNTWTHVAVSRVGTNLRFYVNGTLDTTLTGYGGSISPGTTAPRVGTTKDASGTTYATTGYISNLRIVNGTGLYSSNFTPSTTPLTPITNTSLLTCQSNSFIDNSPNNYALTTTGTPSVQAFSPFGSIREATPISYSNYFGSQSDYLQIASNAVFAFPGAFTVEGWFYWNVTPSPGSLLGTLTAGGFNFYTDGTYLGFNIYGSGNVCTVATFPSRNTWHHIAMTRDASNNCTIWVDGVSSATGTSTQSFVQGAWTIYGGSNNGGSGYNSNLRVVKGTAVYTTAFTPSTTPLTAITNTKLLTCQSTRIIDNSTNNFTITATGSPKVYKYNPFGYTTQTYTNYTPSIHGGSAYFDGTGDYLQIANSPLHASLSNNDFTIECWFYHTSMPAAAQYILSHRVGAYVPFLFWTSSGSLLLYVSSNNSSWDIINNQTLATLITGQWYHLAYTRSGSTFKVFLNGVQVYTFTSSATFTATSNPLNVGASSTDTNSPFFGYITDIRMIRGLSLYNSNFVPPTQTLTTTVTSGSSTYNAVVLLNNTNAGIVDQHGSVVLETVGNAQLIPEDPYSGSYYSNYFDGTSATPLTVSAGSSQLSLPGDFTVECWFMETATTKTIPQFAWSTSGGFACGINAYDGNATRKLDWRAVGSAPIYGVTAITTGVWHHAAYVKSGNTFRIFLDGKLEYYNASYTTTFTSTSTYIGGNNSDTGYSFVGNISNFRVVKGSVIYSTESTTVGTQVFTPPTSPLTAVTNTALLTCQSNKKIDNSTNALAITSSSTTAVKSMNPFQQNTGKSLYFDGTGDYLTIPSNQLMNFGTGDFTVEAWVYPNSLSSDWFIISASGSGGFFVGFSSTSTIGFGWGRAGIAWDYRVAGNATVSTWQHVAVTRSGSSMRLFVNGTQSGTTQTLATAYDMSTTSTTVGSQGANYYLNGYIDDLRVTKGFARYTANFTPPGQLITR